MKFIVHDYETTGLTLHRQAALNQQPRAIEFAGLITDGTDILDRLEFICNPGMDVEPIITKITGLTNEVLREHKSFKSRTPEIAEFFAKGDAIMSHNLSFDKAISRIECQHQGIFLSDINYPAREFCTVEQTMFMFGRRMKLSELYELYVGPYEQKHRAMDDVMLLHAICQKTGIYEAIKRSVCA